MAISTKTEKYVALTYAKYFGKTADKGTIEYYGSIGKTSKILNQIIKDADIEQYKVHGDDLQAEVHNTFQNLFSRNADNKELQKYVKVLQKGKNLPINSIVKKATKFDKDVYNNKQAIAEFVAKNGGGVFDLSKVTKANPIDVKSLTSLTDLQAKIDALPENITGEIYTLTAGVDSGAEFTGTEKGDVFNSGETFLGLNAGAPVYGSNLNALDVLDGGAGKDTLNVKTDSAIGIVTATVKSIETINLESANGVTFNTTTYEGVETLNTTKGTSATLTAGDTTDVNVSNITGAVAVDGGKNVNVTVAATGTTTTIGATTGATGKVTVTDAAQNGAIKVDGGTDVTITASGNNAAGDTIDVGTQATPILPTGAVKVTSTGEISDNGAINAIAMGAINIAGGSTVTVTQSAGITDAQKTAALTATTNDTVTQGAVNVDGGAATTSVTVVQDAAQTVAQYVASPKADGKIGVVAGNVSVEDLNKGSSTVAHTIATVSVTNAGTVAVDSAALATLNLAGTMGTVATTLSTAAATGSATLALNTTGANTGAITLDGDTKTVNVTNSGTSTLANLSAAGATALTVAGSGDLSLATSALLANVTSVNVTNTGSTTFGTTTLNTAASFTAAGGAETVKVGATSKAISMGAGNDEVILVSGATALTGSIDAGEGSTDRITFEVAADVVAATATNVFEGKISGFEELEIAGVNSTNGALVDLGNLDDISKVILSAINTQDLTLDNMANNGTLRVEASQTDTEDITVIVKNAVLSTTDVMNIELAATAGLTTVDVTVANVETINVKTEDTAPTIGNIAHALDLNAAAATSVVVTGNAGVDFTGSAFDDANFTSFDASAVTAGAVTYTSGALVKASTVKGGAGNDVINMAAALAAVTLSGNAGNDTLTGGTVADTINGGEGNDTITGNGGADILTGGAGYDMFKYTTATESNGVNTDTITDFVSGTDKLGITHATKAITYAGEVSGYGTALTTLSTGTATAVLDTSTSTLYVDLNNDGALTVADLAIKLNVNDLSQSDFATFGTAGADTIALTAGVDTIYGLGGADVITAAINTTTLAAVSTDGKSIATTGMDILYIAPTSTVNLTAALGTDANYDAVTNIAAGSNISTTVLTTAVNQVHGLYDYATGTFISSATAAADTASTTDVAASMFLYATGDATTANQGIIVVGTIGNATITDGILTIV